MTGFAALTGVDLDLGLLRSGGRLRGRLILVLVHADARDESGAAAVGTLDGERIDDRGDQRQAEMKGTVALTRAGA